MKKLPLKDEELKELERQAAILEDYFHVFSSDAGERILKSLQEDFDECSYVKDGPEHNTIFNEGRRDMYLQIKKNVESGKDPKKWLNEQSYIREEEDG